MIDASSYKIHDSLIQNWSSYVYGEISSQNLYNIIKNIDCDNKTFIDIGSGSGNVLFELSKIENLNLCGIEIDENRYKTSLKNAEKRDIFEIELMKGDYNELYFGNYDILYCCNCIFEEEDNQKLYKKILKEFKGHCFLFNFDKNLIPYYVGFHIIETSWVKQTELYYFLLQ